MKSKECDPLQEKLNDEIGYDIEELSQSQCILQRHGT